MADIRSIGKIITMRIKYGWRLLATAIGFSLFGFGGLLIFSFFWFNLLRLIIWNSALRNALAQRSICYSFKVYLWFIKLLGAIDYRVIHREKLLANQPCLIIANHPSLLDYVLLTSLIPTTSCMVKASLLNNIFVGGVIKAAGYIPNSQANTLFPLCQQALKQHSPIIIFPEGTRSIPGQPLRFQRGAANIALRCQTDIQLIYIKCTPPMLLKGQKWYKIPFTKSIFTITIGDRIAITDFSDMPFTIAARKLTHHLESYFNQHPH